LTEAAEKASRKELADALRKAGLTARPVSASSTTSQTAKGLPAGVAGRVETLSFAEQIIALRLLHAANRTGKPSLDNLGAIVRCYSHLGMLTAQNWDSSQKVYTARSLLYAQRLVADNSKFSLVFWYRAYARALAGLHAAALDDIEKARQLGKAATADKPSAWSELIEALCRYDGPLLEALAKAERGAGKGLATTLRVLVVEESLKSHLVWNASRAATTAAPENFRAFEARFNFRELGNLKESCELAEQSLGQRIPKRIAAAPDLPATVKRFAETPGAEVQMTRALSDAAATDRDRGEPSSPTTGFCRSSARSSPQFPTIREPASPHWRGRSTRPTSRLRPCSWSPPSVGQARPTPPIGWRPRSPRMPISCRMTST
jgi:hypothetical protein